MKFSPSEISLINETLAEHVGIPKSTIDRIAVQGRLTTYQIGTSGETRVVKVSDVLSWKEHHYQPKPRKNKK